MGKVFVKAKDIQMKGSRFIDTRFDLQDPTWGQEAYRSSHIEGALYWHLERDLSDMSKTEGRHPMPSKQQLKELFEKSGLQLEDTIYIYDQGAAPFAARAWWMLKYANFQNVYIVNGGFDALLDAGITSTQEEVVVDPSVLEISWNESIYASRQDVKKIVDGIEKSTLLDARAGVRYRGEHEPLDKKAGHIPTAKNYDWEQLKEGNSLYVTRALLQSYSKDEELVIYCGSGVTASPLYAVLANEGYENIRLYVGSFSDWITEFDVEAEEN